MISWFPKFLTKRRHAKIIREYYTFCIALGDALSHISTGSPFFNFNSKTWSIRDNETYHKLNELEVAYSELGYRIVPLDVWIDYAGWNVSMEDDFWLINREKGERPIFTTIDISSFPEPSPIIDIAMETGKRVIAETNSDGDTIYRIIDNE